MDINPQRFHQTLISQYGWMVSEISRGTSLEDIVSTLNKESTDSVIAPAYRLRGRSIIFNIAKSPVHVRPYLRLTLYGSKAIFFVLYGSRVVLRIRDKETGVVLYDLAKTFLPKDAPSQSDMVVKLDYQKMENQAIQWIQTVKEHNKLIKSKLERTLLSKELLLDPKHTARLIREIYDMI